MNQYLPVAELLYVQLAGEMAKEVGSYRVKDSVEVGSLFQWG